LKWIARGAGLPEDRLTLRRNRPGRDQAPAVVAARRAGARDLGGGDGVKTVQPGQGDLQRLAREGRLATRASRKGDGLTEADIIRRRAGSGRAATYREAGRGWLVAAGLAGGALLDQPEPR